jgi:hypothetical protein
LAHPGSSSSSDRAAALLHPVGVELKRRPTPFISPSSNGRPLTSSPITGTLMKRRRPFPSLHRLPSPLSPLRPHKRCHHLGYFPCSVLPHLAPLIRAPSRPTPSTDVVLHSSPPPAQPRHLILASVGSAPSPFPSPRCRSELWCRVAPLGELRSSSVPPVHRGPWRRPVYRPVDSVH